MPLLLPAVDDEEFWQGVQPLRFGPLPNLQESVYVVGYPIGGDTVSSCFKTETNQWGRHLGRTGRCTCSQACRHGV